MGTTHVTRIKSGLQVFKFVSCRGIRITLLSSILTPNLSRFSLDLSRFFLILRAFPAFEHFTVSRLISAYLGMSFPSKGLNSGLKWSMNQNLDHCPKPSIYAASQRSKILLSRPNGQIFPTRKILPIFGKCRLTSADHLCLQSFSSPLSIRLFSCSGEVLSPNAHFPSRPAFPSLLRHLLPSVPASPSLPLHRPISNAYRC